ncbi:MAG: radical SAM protein [Oscillospiraceae bacterium]|nr:radical SAM protein [Oscillospiraceae bacterium]
MPKNSIIPVFVPHLGCPNNCVFCNQNRISGAPEPATAQTVKNAIENAAALTLPGSKRQLAFYGGSFTAIPEAMQEELLEAAKPYLDSGFISSIRLSTRPDAIDSVVLRRLERFGVETVELGAQSMDNRVLELSGRGHSAEDVENASRLIKAAGFGLVLQMMTGLPGDTPESAVMTAKRIIALKPDGVRIYPTVIVRDTELCDMWCSGRYTEHTVEDAVSYCARIVPLFEEAGIAIIRMGLNPTEDLSGGDALGGAYHPAMGELVYSRLMRDRAEELLEQAPAGSRIVLGVNPCDLSKAIGQHRGNIEYLKAKYKLKELRIKACDTEKSKIIVISLE